MGKPKNGLRNGGAPSNGRSAKMSPWKKVLYEHSVYPDNFTPDDCFLAAIQRNKNLRRYSLFECLSASSQISMQMSCVIFFSVIYCYLDLRWLSSELTFVAIMGSSLSGYITVLLLPSDHGTSVYSDVRQALIFLSFGLALSPVLYKLTDTISTDTIQTTACFMMAIHLIFHDYGLRGAIVSNAFSLNAALFGSVCLASRLPSSFDAFVLLCLAVQSFVLFPLVRVLVPRRFGIVAALVLGIGATWSAFTVSPPFAFTIMVVLTFVTYGCPLLFYEWQAYKETIHGPWDEAVPVIPIDN